MILLPNTGLNSHFNIKRLYYFRCTESGNGTSSANSKEGVDAKLLQSRGFPVVRRKRPADWLITLGIDVCSHAIG